MRWLALGALLLLLLTGCGGKRTAATDAAAGADGPPDAAVAADAAAVADAPVSGDAAATGDPTPGRIACGDTTCDAATQLCCATRTDAGMPVTYACIAATDSCAGTTAACDEPGDCDTSAGQVCCRPATAAAVSCVAAAACTGGGARELCHVDADCPTDAPACCPSPYTSGGTCRTTCTTAFDGGTGGRDGGRDGGGSTGTPSPGVVSCGQTTCDTSTQVCCVVRGDGGYADTSYTCIGTSDTCAGTVTACDEPGDCSGGAVCCRPSGSQTSTCVDLSTCADRQRCHTNTDCDVNQDAAPKCCPTGGGGAGATAGFCSPADAC